jgi:Na+-driven multidrug efflux pump
LKLKSSLIRGTLILAGAAFIARFLGVIQRIPLQRLLEDIGMASYAIAYNIYFWLLILATAGFPSAVAKLVAEKYATGHQQEGEMIRQAAAKFAWVAGMIASLLVWFGAPLLADISGNPDAVWAIQALAPALLIFPWIAVFMDVNAWEQTVYRKFGNKFFVLSLRLYWPICYSSGDLAWRGRRQGLLSVECLVAWLRQRLCSIMGCDCGVRIDKSQSHR